MDTQFFKNYFWCEKNISFTLLQIINNCTGEKICEYVRGKVDAKKVYENSSVKGFVDKHSNNDVLVLIEHYIYYSLSDDDIARDATEIELSYIKRNIDLKTDQKIKWENRELVLIFPHLGVMKMNNDGFIRLAV